MQAMILPQGVTFALERLQNEGATAYLVGGCVRDHLRGILPHDYDIATDFFGLSNGADRLATRHGHRAY